MSDDDRFTFSGSVEEEVRRIWWEEAGRKEKGLIGPKPVGRDTPKVDDA